MQRQRRKTFHLAAFLCEHLGCKKHCKSLSGLKRHHEAVHAIPAALLICSEQPGLQPQHGEAVPSHSFPPASPEPEVEDLPANNVDDLVMNMRTPSPTFSSRRSPRRLPNGSPLPNARRTSPPPINNGLNVDGRARLHREKTGACGDPP
jgi:hypothetical protein